MPLQVLPLELSDFDQLIRQADTGSPGDDCVAPLNVVAWPVSTQAEARLRARCAFALQKLRMTQDPTVRWLKAVDTEAPEDDNIVAVVRWHFYADGYDYTREGHWEMAPNTIEPLLPYIDDGEDLSSSYPPANFDFAMHNDVITNRDGFRPQWFQKGKPCWVMTHLTTRPSHRRRGAAAMLILWGLTQATKTKAPAYLEAGPAGKPLYEKLGFEQVGEMRMVTTAVFGRSLDVEISNMEFDPERVAGREGSKRRPDTT